MAINFKDICEELIILQKAKDTDYGSSFKEMNHDFGIIASVIPIANKVSRLKKIAKSNSIEVKGESIKDTLKDLACYAIMALMELDDSQELNIKHREEEWKPNKFLKK